MDDTMPMAATYEDIERWLHRGKEEGATHVIIACDTFSWTDYPVYVMPDHDVQQVVNGLHGKNMQKVMEVYNLALSLEDQLREWKFGSGGAWHL